jgi:hypothetical protein
MVAYAQVERTSNASPTWGKTLAGVFGTGADARVVQLPEDARDADFLSADVGYAVGGSQVWATADGGRTWVPQAIPFEGDPSVLSFDEVACDREHCSTGAPTFRVLGRMHYPVAELLTPDRQAPLDLGTWACTSGAPVVARSRLPRPRPDVVRYSLPSLDVDAAADVSSDRTVTFQWMVGRKAHASRPWPVPIDAKGPSSGVGEPPSFSLVAQSNRALLVQFGATWIWAVEDEVPSSFPSMGPLSSVVADPSGGLLMTPRSTGEPLITAVHLAVDAPGRHVIERRWGMPGYGDAEVGWIVGPVLVRRQSEDAAPVEIVSLDGWNAWFSGKAGPMDVCFAPPSGRTFLQDVVATSLLPTALFSQVTATLELRGEEACIQDVRATLWDIPAVVLLASGGALVGWDGTNDRSLETRRPLTCTRTP